MIQNNSDDWLTDIEYKVLLELYHTFYAAFVHMPDYIKDAFYRRLNTDLKAS